MDFALSEDQAAVRGAIRDLFRRFTPAHPGLRLAILEEKVFPEALWEALAEGGWQGALVPPRYGGTQLGVLPLAFLAEELAAEGYALALFILTAMDTACLVEGGPQATRDRFLPDLARGRLRLCFALTEAEAGSNSFRVSTRAERDPDGWRLTGEKIYITGADHADLALVVARTTSRSELEAQGLPKGFGFTLFLVPTDAPGLSLSRLPTEGIEGMDQFTVHLDGVVVPDDHRVGEVDGGGPLLFQALNIERILASATIVGAARHALGLAVDHARTRRVFRGVPIGTYQAIQHPLAEVRIRQEAVQLLTWKAAAALDAGASPAEVAWLGNAAKHLASELGLMAVDRAIQTLGGSGFSAGTGLTRTWTAMRLFKTAPVSSEMVLNYVAEHVLGLPRSY